MIKYVCFPGLLLCSTLRAHSYLAPVVYQNTMGLTRDLSHPWRLHRNHVYVGVIHPSLGPFLFFKSTRPDLSV
jgi:hypothetical protein